MKPTDDLFIVHVDGYPITVQREASGEFMRLSLCWMWKEYQNEIPESLMLDYAEGRIKGAYVTVVP